MRSHVPLGEFLAHQHDPQVPAQGMFDGNGHQAQQVVVHHAIAEGRLCTAAGQLLHQVLQDLRGQDLR
jgi:hypothetical protein